MPQQTMPDPPALAALDSVIAEWYEARESGGEFERREWLARYPHLAAELTAFFDDHENFERLKSALLANPPAEARTLLPEGGDRYAIEGELARGGMAVVLRAVERGMKRPVAMKVLPAGAGAAAERRFVEEARLMGRLEHPNIVPVHELGTNAQGQLFFSMKLLQGRSLKEVLDALRDPGNPACETYTLVRLLRAFIDVCNGLAFAHSKGVIHRDLKPSNVMLGDFGEVLEMDWGLAKVIGARETSCSDSPETRNVGVPADATQAGTILGTPLYMPPEQAAGRIAEIDARSDVYSLGAILYEILCLEPPIEAGPLPGLLLRVIEGRIVPPERRASHRARPIPKELSAIALKALARSPDARYPTVAEMRRDVELFLEGHAVSAKEDSPMETIMKLIQRNKAVSVATLIFTLILAGVIGITFEMSSKARAEAERAERAAQAERKIAEEARKNAEQALVAYTDAETRRAAMARNSVSAFITAARRAIEQRKLDDALAQVSVAVEYAPENPAARLLKGQILIALNKRRDGVSDLTAYTKLNPGDADGARLAQLAAASKEEDFNAASELIDIFMRQREFYLAECVTKDSERMMEIWRRRLEAAYPGVRPAEWGPIGDLLVRTKEGRLEFRYNAPGPAAITDLTPFKGLPLNTLEIANGLFSDLAPLEGMPLTALAIPGSQVSELGPLDGMKLKELNIGRTLVKRLTPLKGMPLEVLNVSKDFPTRSSEISSIEVLRGMPLRVLSIEGTAVEDLSPLESAKLEDLNLGSTRVSDISILRGMPLKKLNVAGTTVGDLSALQGAPLTHLNIWATNVTDLAPLKGAPLENLFAQNQNIKDLAPLQGAPLNFLVIDGAKELADIAALKGAPLKFLTLAHTKVTDISVLKGMHLRDLYLNNSPVEDLTPLEGMDLYSFACNPRAIKKGIEVLKPMKNLNNLKMDSVQTGWMTPEQFWANYERIKRGEPTVEPEAPPPAPQAVQPPRPPDERSEKKAQDQF